VPYPFGYEPYGGRRQPSSYDPYGGSPLPYSPISYGRLPEERQPGILDYLGEAAGAVGSGVSTGLHYALYPFGLGKQAVDWLARQGARAQGLNVPDTATVGSMFGEVVSPVTERRDSYGRTLLGRGAEFAADVALDPLTWAGIPALSQASKGRAVAAKILAEQPGIALYAKPVAQALASAVEKPGANAFVKRLASTIGANPETVVKAQLVAEKALHGGFATQMALGGAQGLSEAAKGYMAEGFTPEVAGEALVGALSGGMAGMALHGQRKASRARAEGIAASRAVKPTETQPIDRIPDLYQEDAEWRAHDLAQAILQGNSDKALVEMPDHLRPYVGHILEQAKNEAMAMGEGRDFLDRVKQEHEKGAEGISREDRPGVPGSWRLIQRNQNGDIVGAAQVDGDSLTFITGGRAMGAKESVRPLYEELTRLGVERQDNAPLTALGAMARRRAAERQLNLPRAVVEGSVTRKEMRTALEEARRGIAEQGIGEGVLGPAYQVSPEQARRIKMTTELPQTPEFEAAVAGTPSAQVTPDGLLVDVTRYQQAVQAGEPSIRTGVFYLPSGSAQAKYYRRSGTTYGGKYELQGPTLLRRPLFVKGATGGRAPQAAYDQLNGKGAYEAMRNDVLQVTNRGLYPGGRAGADVQGVARVLEKYGADPSMASEIVHNSREGNQLPYAVQENIVAHAVRKAGYDSVLGWSKGRGAEGRPFLSEIFDVREADYPVRGEPGTLRPEFEPAYAAGETAKPFFSQLRRVVDEPKTQGKQTGEQWARFLSDPKRGVKADELKWTGLDDFLAERKGQPVTREEIQQHLDQNEVRVEEVTKGGARELPWKEIRPDAEGRRQWRGGLVTGGSPRFEIVEYESGGKPIFELSDTDRGRVVAHDFGSLEEAKRAAGERTAADLGEGTEFEQYVEPGGKNYRELLLTLPEREANVPPPNIWKRNASGRWAWFAGDQQVSGAFPLESQAEQARASINTAGSRRDRANFRSGHFEEPNVLAHVRFNDRVDAEGKKTLFVEEIQSDWAQKGRREGISKQPEKIEVQPDKPGPFGEKYWKIIVDGEDHRTQLPSEDLANRTAVMIREGGTSGVPSGPFIGDTGKWTELAMKRVLKYAADNGYDKVAWTTGEQQADRYDLSKQIDRVSAWKDGPDTYSIQAIKDGDVLVDKKRLSQGELVDAVGKDAADKIVAQGTEEHKLVTLEGLDLKVGGEGMKAFYDQILPQVASKLGKKFGAKAGKSDLDFPPKWTDPNDYIGDEISTKAVRELIDSGSLDVLLQQQATNVLNAMVDRDLTLGEAMSLHGSAALAEKFGGRMVERSSNLVSVNSIDIPPQMRETVRKEGFPLFAVDKGERQAVAENMRGLLLKLYPEGSKIKESGAGYEITLPDKRVVRWKPGVDHIEIDLEAFEKGHGPRAGREAAGVTYRLPSSAVVEIVKGASPRVPLHEHWHVIKHLGTLTEKQLATLKKKFGGDEEKEADAYADWFEGGMKKPDSIWQRIHQGVTNLYEALVGSEKAVFRQATEGALKPHAPVSEMSRQPGEYWKRMWGPEGPLAKQRAMKGEDTKRAVGAPPGINVGADFLGLKDRLKEMAQEGQVARPWYRRSSQMILNAVGGNKVDAEKIAQLVAIYSSQTPVPANIEAALRAWNQFKAGAKEISSGRNRSQDRRAEDLLFRGKNWEGRKTNNFYGNLMLQIDPTNPTLKDLVTVDVHMMRAIGYDTDSPAEQQYRWAENLFKDIADDLGWEPHEVQAAVWTSQKYRREVLAKLKPGETPPPVTNYDFADAAAAQVGHINMEAVPHPTTGVLPELGSAPFAVRQQYTQGMRSRVLLDAEGRDRVAMLLGIPTQGGFLAPGYYKGQLEPGFKAEVAMTPEVGGLYAALREMGHGDWEITKDLRGEPQEVTDSIAKSGYHIDRENKRIYVDPRLKEPQRAKLALTALGDLTGKSAESLNAYERARELDPYTKQQMERYAAIMGYILRQEGVGYGRTFKAKKKDANAYHIDIGRQLTESETEGLMREIATALGTNVTDPRLSDIFPKTKRDGVTIVNYGDGFSNAEVLAAAAKAGADVFGVDNVVNAGYARELGGLVFNSWGQHPNGEGYAKVFADEAASGGSPDLLGRVERLRQEADAYNRDFAVGQGWAAEPEGGARTVEPRAAEAEAVTEPTAPRGPPSRPAGSLEPKFAASPAPAPEPEPLGRPMRPDEAHRVEHRVESLEKALEEQKRLGLPTQDLNLARATRRTWESLDPKVREKLKTWRDEDVLDKITNKEHLDDVEVQALDAVVRGRREAKELARIEYQGAVGTPEEATARKKYADSLANFLTMERANVNDGTGTARALAARARIMQAGATADRQFMRQVFREMPHVSDADAAELQRMFETGDSRLSDALRAATSGRWKQWQTLLRAFLITPSSEIANTLGNTLVQGIEVADTAAAAGVDWVASRLRGTGRERYVGEVGAEIGGMLNAVPEALSSFLKERFWDIYRRAWTGESKKIEAGKRRLEYQVSPFKSKLGRLFATSLDALQAGDELFQAPVAQGELVKRAYRMARTQLGGKASMDSVQARTLEIAAEAVRYPERHAQLLGEIKSAVDRRLFRNKPWKPVEIIRQMTDRYPWLTAVLPFVKTPANIARYAIHHSPLGMMTPEFGRALEKLVRGKGEMTQGQAADVVAQRLVGTMIFGSAVAMAKMGKTTGSGPADPDERKALMETGWRPYSFRIQAPGGQTVYVPFSRFDPVAQMFGVAADIVELPDMRDANDVASKAIGSIAENFTNRTYLKGLIDFSEAVNDPLRFAGQYASNIAAMHIPRQAARFAQAIDPVMRDVRPSDKGVGGFMERVLNTAKSNVPWLSEGLPAKYGPTGEPIVRPGMGIPGGVMRAFSPIQISPERPGRTLEGTMAKIGYVPAPPKNVMTIQGQAVPISPRLLELVHQADKAAAYELRMLIGSPIFERLPDTVEEGGSQSKEGVMRKIYEKHRDLARTRIRQSWEFQRTAREELAKARAQARGGTA
jgi:hypothetical protein